VCDALAAQIFEAILAILVDDLAIDEGHEVIADSDQIPPIWDSLAAHPGAEAAARAALRVED
jgi:hypothetical protein